MRKIQTFSVNFDPGSPTIKIRKHFFIIYSHDETWQPLHSKLTKDLRNSIIILLLSLRIRVSCTDTVCHIVWVSASHTLKALTHYTWNCSVHLKDCENCCPYIIAFHPLFLQRKNRQRGFCDFESLIPSANLKRPIESIK